MDTKNDIVNTVQMSLEVALDELEIIELTNLDKEYIKKQYHKLALKCHPDKNKDNYAKEKFQKINEAYEYLMGIVGETDDNLNTSSGFVSSSVSKEPKIYIDLLTTFISSLLLETNKEDIIRIIKEIVSETTVVLTVTYIRKLFEKLDNEKAFELYQLLYKYRCILYISDDTLEVVSLIVKEKLEKEQVDSKKNNVRNDKLIILNPNIKDIMEHNVYKLYVDERLYLVPLWHNELYFDALDGSEIIVLCQPKLPNELTIDENNNIHYEKCINVEKDLLNLIKKDKFVSIEIGDKWFSIPINKLLLKDEQIYTLKNQGIARILEKNMYDVSCKGDIIVKILLV